MMQRLLLLAGLCLLGLQASAQNKNNMDEYYSRQWKIVDSFMEQQLPQSAEKEIQTILAKAQAEKNEPQQIKAHLYLMSTSDHQDEQDTAAISKAEAQIATSRSDVAKAVWQSITADMYWQYFQRHRYRLYNRTTLEETTSGDIATWDAPAFSHKIATLYIASLENREQLKAIPVQEYAPIILHGVNTKQLRPTLYDLLVFRAISFFENDEKDVTNPADKFEIEGNPWFEDAARFSEVRVKVKNADALHFKALRLYQEVIAFHLHDSRPDALIDVDVQRLNFVHNNSVSADKDSLYLQALQRLELTYKNESAAAQVSYLIAAQQMGQQPVRPYYRGNSHDNVAPRKDRHLAAIKAKLQQIISRFPETEGGVNAFNLLQQLEEQSVSIQVEEVNIPNEHIRALLQYKNVDAVYLKLYKLNTAEEAFGSNGYVPQDSILQGFKLRTPLRQWEQPLPGSEDLEQHSTEILVNALPAGSYVLLSSLKDDIGADDNLVSSVQFQVSSLSLVTTNNEGKGYVLDRKTGYPVEGVHVQFLYQEYKSGTGGYRYRKAAQVTSGRGGNFIMPKYEQDRRNIAASLLTKGTDSLFLPGYYNRYYNSSSGVQESKRHTFFFTDRSIYRPGQTIYFKGIMVNSGNGGRDNKVLANKKTKVFFYDANEEAITSLDVVTNEFGSFQGKFTAPDGLLTGEMYITDEDEDSDEDEDGVEYGRTTFSVEEYKRPKFYVEFDTLKGAYALDESVTIKGFAKAYAGSNIDGATVKYRVVRRARFPYYWVYYRWGMPSSEQMEIVNGETTTNEDGSFDIDFVTIPDKSVNPESLPIFTYTVYADVTDINGETRSGDKSLNCGYRSLELSTNVNEDSKPADLKTLQVRTENPNGVFTAAPVQLSISRLQFPGMLRQRLWQKPDQFVMTEAEFRKAFPGDEYKNEANYLNWEKENPAYERSFTTTAEGTVNIPEATWYRNGWYVIELKTRDAQGHEIVEKKYTHVWAPGKKEANQKALSAFAEKAFYEPGDELELWIATAADNPYLLSDVEPQRLAGAAMNKRPLTIKITEAERGGIAFSWAYVYNNRVYTANKTIAIPWTNKDLDLEWATHRDKLQPGAVDEWTLTIKGDKKEKVAAELLAGMYDASLDALKTHHWNWSNLVPSVYSSNPWQDNHGFGLDYGQLLKSIHRNYKSIFKDYDRLLTDEYQSGVDEVQVYGRNIERRRYTAALTTVSDSTELIDAEASDYASAKVSAPIAKHNEEVANIGLFNIVTLEVPAPNELPKVSVRTNLQETAFFFPQMQTDAEGNISFKFTMPEALTEWKMMAFAHTKDWKTGYLEGKVKTQKDLMVVPNLPRFFRQNDDMLISTKINNLSDKALNGEASLEILDATTLQPLNLPFRLAANKQDFSAAQGQSTLVNWNIHVPESIYTPVVVRIVAKAGNFSDGEENTLSVITNRTLVTETLPLPIRGGEEKVFTLEKLRNQQSNTLSNHALTVEFTGNPAWYAVQALPYLMEYPYECAEQTFNRFYANALAGHIVAQSPKVAKVFEQWKNADTAALLSNLQKNEELKSALLEETPWVMEAKDENEQKHRIAALFETHKLARELSKNLDKLEQMQLSEGGFPWFRGMSSDRYITQYILSGIARLQHLGVKASDKKDATKIVEKALPYLDRKLQDDYEELLRRKADLQQQQIGYTQLQYLYMRSFFTDRPVPAATKKAFEYYQKQAARYWTSFNPYLQGQVALALYRSGDAKTAQQVVASLKERAINKEEMGMYWKEMPRGYWWYEAPVEAQSLLIEAFGEIAKDEVSVDAMKVWLLKQKQTQNWPTTKATADAVYALLLQGSDWLTNEPQVNIQLGKEVLKSTEIKTEAGTGYFKKKYTGAEVKPEMGEIKVKVDYGSQTPGKSNTGVSWGAIYWQYFEDLDKITAAATPLSLSKKLYIERNSASGPVLTEIKEGNQLKVGDKVKVRIELRADRDMEYVHLKDMRAACLEPVNVLSEYKYQGGLGYYESTKDVSTNFFFSYLRKGTYVFEYPVFVTAKGNFSNGIATIQCMYAPEFSSHSEGIRVNVQ